LATLIATLLGFLSLVCYIRRSRRKLKVEVEDKNVNHRQNKDENEDLEIAVFGFGTIAQATDTFSFRNKLGQGGFGSVYKVKATVFQYSKIAVKRLTKSSGQGLNEFKTEEKLIAKLQHRNLVKILGCCIHGDERMLVYEYMLNRSLDYFIFDQTKSKVLTWSKRFHIICGIARGLLYLHQDSRLRIIHRDLKASNVLLDGEMNPKISDFGLARTFGGNQTEANTNRIVGTYGYMAPEYATDGLFSVKSDCHLLWTEGKPSDVADDFLVETGDLPELLRCIHISLLCVQQHPEERPSMSSVVLMLGSHNELPSPKQHGFLFYNKPIEADPSPGNDGPSSRNEMIG
ncbi:G-type lectin S-receptor-like serine/threonine-protein kinase SD1-1, partial [Hibiscus syriacus]|uniref:G-type lectin S-receptor-like serine/threonine-protein kinase SD1-1 n=1 Tax=Hibiscus syriacus TaxID=106335 RepID=UPI0019233FA3